MSKIYTAFAIVPYYNVCVYSHVSGQFFSSISTRIFLQFCQTNTPIAEFYIF